MTFSAPTGSKLGTVPPGGCGFVDSPPTYSLTHSLTQGYRHIWAGYCVNHTTQMPATPLPMRTTANTKKSTAITAALFWPNQDFQLSRMPEAFSPRLTMTTRGAATPRAAMATYMAIEVIV